MGGQEKYIDIISCIAENFKIMKAARPLPESAVRRYREESDILSSYCSNAIEGNTFTYDETRLLIKEGITSSSRTMREHNDVLGHSRAFWSLYDSLKAGKIIDEEFILKLHSDVLLHDGYAGRYRDAGVYIGNFITAAYVAPDADKVPGLIKAYVEKIGPEIRSNIDGVLKSDAPGFLKLFLSLAEHHIDFERIHPFFDGNGRTGRLLLNYELLQTGLLPLNITTADRKRYISAFSNFEDKDARSTRPESKYERMAKLLAECEVNAMEEWLKMFKNYIVRS